MAIIYKKNDDTATMPSVDYRGHLFVVVKKEYDAASKGNIRVACMSERLTHDLEQLGRYHAYLVDKETWRRSRVVMSSILRADERDRARTSQSIPQLLGWSIIDVWYVLGCCSPPRWW